MPAPNEFVVPGNTTHMCNSMELNDDLPLVALVSEDPFQRQSLILRYSPHKGTQVLYPFALLYFDMVNLDPAADSKNTMVKTFAADLVNDASIIHCVATYPVYNAEVRQSLELNEALFNVVEYPAEVAALAEANIITLSNRTITIGDQKTPCPIGTINITMQLEDYFNTDISEPKTKKNDKNSSRKTIKITKPTKSTKPTEPTKPTNLNGCICFSFFRPSMPTHTLYAFIVFTFFQILVFLFCPQLYQDAAPDMDIGPTFPSFRLIGIQECGLILVYIGIAHTNDLQLMMMTVLGRMTVIPFTVFCVFYLKAPWTMLFGILQDVSFGFWTYIALKKTNNRKNTKAIGTSSRLVAAGTFGLYTRIILFVAGLLCVYGGWVGLFYPEFMLREQLPLFHFMNGGLKIKTNMSIYLGTRSVSLIYFLVGCYQITIGILNAHPIVFFSCAMYHFTAIAVFTLMKLWREDLDKAYHIPGLHFAAAPMLLILSLFSFGQVEVEITKNNNRKID
jgi:hypothetical protein